MAYEAARRWLAGQVLLKIACLLMRWQFSLAGVVVHGDRAKSARLLALRHENTVRARHRLHAAFDQLVVVI